MAVLQFPLAGLDRRFSYQNQRPFTTPNALNVFPAGGADMRERGSRRPGCDAAFYEELGGGNKVNLLNNCTVFGADGLNIWEDTFESTSRGEAWSIALPGFTDVFVFRNPTGFASVRADQSASLVRRPFNISDANDRGVEIFIKPYKGAHCGTYRLYTQLNNASPAWQTDGYFYEIAFGVAGAYTWRVGKYQASVLTTIDSGSGDDTVALPGWMRLQNRLTATANANKVFASWRSAVHRNGVDDTFNNGGGAGIYAGNSVGFSATGTATSSERCLIDTFRVRRYLTSTAQSRNKILLAAANGLMYRESPMGRLENKVNSSYSNVRVASDRALSSVEYQQKLYIADAGEVVCKGTDGSISTATLTSATIGSWVTAGVDVNNHLLRMTACSDPTVILGAWKIASISGGGDVNLNLDPAYYPGTAGTVGSITFEVVRGPKMYTPSTSTTSLTASDAFELWVCEASKGTIPARCKVVSKFLDRVILAFPDDNPQIIYFLRAGNPRDCLLGGVASDTARALADALAEPGTCVAPWKNDYCIVSSINEIVKYTGDPGYGGSRRSVVQGEGVGIIGAWAFCYGPSGEMYYMSRDGLYVLPPGADAVPQALSRERLPMELLHLDASVYTVQLAYSRRYRGVMIFLSHDPLGENAGVSYSSFRQHWFFGLDSGGFWPISLAADFEPISSVGYDGRSDEDSGVLLGGRDGYVRKFSDRYDRDGVDPIQASVTIGPAPLSGPGRTGMLNRLRIVLGEDSESIGWRVYAGSTPEECAKSTTIRASGTAVAGASPWFDPKVSGVAYRLDLLSAVSPGNYGWEVENAVVELSDVGVTREQ